MFRDSDLTELLGIVPAGSEFDIEGENRDLYTVRWSAEELGYIRKGSAARVKTAPLDMPKQNAHATVEGERDVTMDFDVTLKPAKERATLTCSSCGHENDGYSPSCEECGNRLTSADFAKRVTTAPVAVATDSNIEIEVMSEPQPAGTNPETKRCPFCAEEIKYEAIKCRFCGEMLGDNPRPAAAHTATSAMHETKVFLVPFPDGSPPLTTPFNLDSAMPFSKRFFQRIGYKKADDSFRSWRNGVTYVWDAYKDYFIERLNELGKEGWELGEPLETIDSHGWLVSPNDRFETRKTVAEGAFGKVTRDAFVGARFLMRRTTFR